MNCYITVDFCPILLQKTMKANLILWIEIILFSVFISLTSQAVFKVKLHKGCAKSPQGCPKKEKEERTDNRKTGNSGIKSFLRTQVEHQTMVLSAQSTNDSYYYYNSFDTRERTSFNEALKNYINVRLALYILQLIGCRMNRVLKKI